MNFVEIIQSNDHILSDGKIKVSAGNLMDRLQLLAQRVVDKLPDGHEVAIHRSGEHNFMFSIVEKKRPVQQFAINWDPATQFVTWAAVL